MLVGSVVAITVVGRGVARAAETAAGWAHDQDKAAGPSRAQDLFSTGGHTPVPPRISTVWENSNTDRATGGGEYPTHTHISLYIQTNKYI